MVKKLLVLILLFYIPVQNVSYLISGFHINGGIIQIFLFSLILGISAWIVDPIVAFLALKEKVITKVLATLIVVYAVGWAVSTYFHLITYTAGKFGISQQYHISGVSHLVITINAAESAIIASALFAIWAITVKLLIND